MLLSLDVMITNSKIIYKTAYRLVVIEVLVMLKHWSQVGSLSTLLASESCSTQILFCMFSVLKAYM